MVHEFESWKLCIINVPLKCYLNEMFLKTTPPDREQHTLHANGLRDYDRFARSLVATVYSPKMQG